MIEQVKESFAVNEMHLYRIRSIFEENENYIKNAPERNNHLTV